LWYQHNFFIRRNLYMEELKSFGLQNIDIAVSYFSAIDILSIYQKMY
jgi:hypothetical protein